MRFHVVTHCYAAKFPHYAEMLKYHLSGFVNRPPTNASVWVTVHCCPEDRAVIDVIDYFQQTYPALDLNAWMGRPATVGRRAIGRNSSALTTASDCLVFTDVDHVWLGGAFDAIEQQVPNFADVAMIWPREIRISKSHENGDAYVNHAHISGLRLVDIDVSDFVPKHYNRAIGGVQIVPGDFAREHGYLNNTKWTNQEAAVPFGDFKDDVAFRQYCLGKGRIVALDYLPDVYRIRHSTTSYQGPPP